jgi:Transposase DDE domain
MMKTSFPTGMSFLVLAIDGSSVNLPKSKVLIEEFGEIDNLSSTYTMAQMSCCHDVLNHVTIAATLTNSKESEFKRACSLIETTSDLKDLFLFDRGYSALWFMHFLTRKGKDYVIRLRRTTFFEFANQSNPDVIKDIRTLSSSASAIFSRWDETFVPFKVRLIQVTLDSGEIEFLATSLLDVEKYPTSIFKDLYAMRWQIEEYYKHMKVHTELENFSGRTVHSVYQDFYAGIFVENIRVMIELDVNEELRKSSKNKGNQYQYQVNRNLSLGILKDKLFDIFMSKTRFGASYEHIKKLFEIVPIPIIPDRHNPRNLSNVISRSRFFTAHRRTT